MILSLIDLNNPMLQQVAERCGEPVFAFQDVSQALHSEADILITSGGQPLLDEEKLSAMPSLKLILSVSAGVDKLPREALERRGITVCNARGAHALSIAEYVLGAMLAFSYRIPQFVRNQERRLWQHAYDAQPIEGKTLCVIGAGHIGSMLGRKASALGMRVIGLKRRPEPIEGFQEVRPVSALHETLPEADFAALVTPLTPETYHLMDEAAFARMKPSAVFINVSRGDTADEEALIRALENKQIAGAILDVFHTEPLPADSPLWSMPNVLISPHNGGFTQDASDKTALMMVENIRRFREGRPLLNVVDLSRGY